MSTKQHKFYCGVDLHARTLYLCIPSRCAPRGIFCGDGATWFVGEANCWLTWLTPIANTTWLRRQRKPYTIEA